MKYIYFIKFCSRGQDAVSISHHIANTNVASNWVGSVDSDDQADKISKSMTTDDYKVLIKSKDVLDRGTLNVTIEELERIGESRLIQEIKRVIADNKIEKPTSHNKQDDQATEYYKIDLTPDDIDSIVSMFGNREVESLGRDYEPTRAASFYATMLDNWNRMLLD